MPHDADARTDTASPDPGTESAKWDAYGATVLEFPGPPEVTVDLRREPTSPMRQALTRIVGARCFAVFTAENPAGKNTEDAGSPQEEERREERNARRRGRLESELDSLGVPHVPVDGVAPDGNYRERCAAAVMPREDAAALARRYGQLAFFWFDGDRFWVHAGIAGREPRVLPDPPE